MPRLIKRLGAIALVIVLGAIALGAMNDVSEGAAADRATSAAAGIAP